MKYKTKIWLYFLLFTAIIFSILWILQITLLPTFYEKTAISNVEKIAYQISQNKESENLTQMIDEYAFDNSLLIYLTDKNGNVIYSSDEYSRYYKTGNDYNGNPYRNQGTSKTTNRNLPSDYNEFQELLLTSETGKVNYRKDNSYIYGMMLDDNDILYVRTWVEAIGNTVNVLKLELVIVTIISIIIAFIISFMISKLFARPIEAITRQARELANKKYEVNTGKGFCKEFDELSDTLNQTAEKLEQADQYERELLSNVSHDLRTPLTMIKGYAESIKDFPEDEVQRNNDVDIIIRETDRLAELVNEIIDYSKLQEKQEVKFEKVNLKELIENILIQFSGVTNCQIEKQLDEIETVVDKSKMKRALYNLIDNSVKHAKSKVKVVLQKNEQYARIEIIDDGKGIQKEDIMHIWDRYYSTRNSEKGFSSGLGLSIVKQIVELHNGKCGVESELDKGSTFWIELNN